MTNLKFITRCAALLVFMLGGLSVHGQEVIVTDSTSISVEEDIQAKIEDRTGRFKVDGVAAVVGDYVVLESDIDKLYLELQNQDVSMEGVTDCNLAGRIMEDKLYAHHAIQDSIIVPDSQISSQVDQQLAYMTQHLGSMEKVVEFYQKESEAEIRALLFPLLKERALITEMRRSVVEAVEITPEEVRAFFAAIPEDERPIFSDEVELAQIVIRPEIPEEEKQEIIDRLNEMRADVLENGASFNTKAVLYSDDTESKSSGGKITLSRTDPFVKEFKDAAFSLQEGEISKPFETMFGFHILTVDRIRGQQVDVRHILLIPDVTEKTKQEAFEKIQEVREKIVSDQISFAEAAREVSDEEETRESGGMLINPISGDTKFDLTKVDPLIYERVVNLKEGEVSNVLTDQDRTGRPFYKIITVINRIPEHKASYAQDYNKIRDLALRDKEYKAIEKWQAEKIDETYVKVNGTYRDCEFSNDWIKK